MNQRVFLDTVGLVAVLNKSDEYHHSASRLFSDFGRESTSVVTTDFVLGELGNVLARTVLRNEAVWLMRELHRDQRSEVVYIDSDMFAEATDLYSKRNDKSWGLVDCLSFVVMNKLGLLDAFTADRHFQQAGFRCLL